MGFHRVLVFAQLEVAEVKPRNRAVRRQHSELDGQYDFCEYTGKSEVEVNMVSQTGSASRDLQAQGLLKEGF